MIFMQRILSSSKKNREAWWVREEKVKHTVAHFENRSKGGSAASSLFRLQDQVRKPGICKPRSFFIKMAPSPGAASASTCRHCDPFRIEIKSICRRKS